MADDDVDPIDVLRRALSEPEQVTEGSTTVKMPDLATLAGAVEKVKASDAAKSGGLGLMYKRFVPPGTQGP